MDLLYLIPLILMILVGAWYVWPENKYIWPVKKDGTGNQSDLVDGL